MPVFLTEVRDTSGEGEYKRTNVRKNKVAKMSLER
jgi:hypothetical protein